MVIFTGLFQVLKRPITQSRQRKRGESIDNGTKIPDNGVIPPEDSPSAAMREFEPSPFSENRPSDTSEIIGNQHVDTRHFSITRTISDIPAPERCPFCGDKTVKCFVPYDCVGARWKIENKEAPGYRCDGCGAELYDSLTDKELLVAAAEHLDPNHDFKLREILLKQAARTSEEGVTRVVQLAAAQ